MKSTTLFRNLVVFNQSTPKRAVCSLFYRQAEREIEFRAKVKEAIHKRTNLQQACFFRQTDLPRLAFGRCFFVYDESFAQHKKLVVD